MISSISGESFTRLDFKNIIKNFVWLMVVQKYNPNAINDLFKIVWHPYLQSDRKYDRLVVVPPTEILKQCYKIDRSRRRGREKEDEIEAVIMKWCNDQNARPLRVVFTNRAAVLFFDNGSEAVFARCALLKFTCDFVNRCWEAT